MPELRLHNSLTRRREAFAPLDPAHVRLYVCGPTVYDLAHLGNARPVVVFDVLVRLLRRLYPRVTYVRNITDVDDKINARAAESGEPIAAITARTTADFHADIKALNALPPDVEPRATAHVPEMIAIIERLIENGHAYEAEGHVLFSVASFPAYGMLSGRSPDELVAGARVDVAPYKRDAGDFVLWKPSTPDLPGWDSPWGRGRPGWHIECSAMSWRYLGETFDIHGGGQDLLFPHHENEVAQSCCAFPGSGFARVWLHNGMLLVNGQKMSKSLGNFLTIRGALAKAPGEAVRLLLLKAHYRSTLDFSDSALIGAEQDLAGFYEALRAVSGHDDITPNENLVAPLFNWVTEPLLDDLNTPIMVSRLHWVKSAIRSRLAGHAHAASNGPPINLISDFNNASLSDVREILRRSGNAIGILQYSQDWIFHRDSSDEELEEIELAILQRQNARKAKNFALSDAIRDDLATRGILLEDGPNGTTWRRA